MIVTVHLDNANKQAVHKTEGVVVLTQGNTQLRITGRDQHLRIESWDNLIVRPRASNVLEITIEP